MKAHLADMSEVKDYLIEFIRRLALAKKALAMGIIVFIAMGYSSMARAESGSGSQFGAIYGLSVADAQNTNPHILTGFKGAALLTANFSLGGYYMYTGKEYGSGSEKFDYVLQGLEGAFHIPSGGGDTFFGVRVGLSKFNTKPTGVDVIFSPYHYGVAAGYDYVLSSWLTFGFEGSYLYVEKSHATKNSVRYDQESIGMINFLVALQFKL